MSKVKSKGAFNYQKTFKGFGVGVQIVIISILNNFVSMIIVFNSIIVYIFFDHCNLYVIPPKNENKLELRQESSDILPKLPWYLLMQGGLKKSVFDFVSCVVRFCKVIH